jgi:BirA family biotin operon repressor/biotin-[acetyl-CoA-carboxylase] ligase
MSGRILWFPETTSTNDVAAIIAERGADEGSVVVADMQTSGRGRLGRSWSSPAGAGIYASVVLRPGMREAPLLTIAAGVAIAEGVAAATGLEASLRWPNDVYVGPRKLAGILAEGAATHIVVGFGVNVLDAAYPPDVAARATCLARELGRFVDRGEVLAECLSALWRRYQDLTEYRERSVIEAWRARAASMMGQAIEWEHHGTIERGRAKDVDETGALLMTTETGVIRVISGEVRWI